MFDFMLAALLQICESNKLWHAFPIAFFLHHMFTSLQMMFLYHQQYKYIQFVISYEIHSGMLI